METDEFLANIRNTYAVRRHTIILEHPAETLSQSYTDTDNGVMLSYIPVPGILSIRGRMS